MKNLLAIVALVTFSSCAQSQSSNLKIPQGSTTKTANEAVATFGEGCFWHAEIVFQSLVGVRDAVSGYAGGSVANPDYETVCSGSTGHAEVVQVYYDTTKITYETLVKAFFASMDPTELNRQGNDEGTQYRSVAFYRNDKEKQIIEAEIKRITDAKKYSHKIVTQVVPLKSFYDAEAYHQDYARFHPDDPYIVSNDAPKVGQLREQFPDLYKK